mmetsp:Transcript_7602/g.11297  ORF Transcript_7602/g.11297 Transcript_7602/m.11297 type:complete len:227 (+) Transcript_7602:749-1429(+)
MSNEQKIDQYITTIDIIALNANFLYGKFHPGGTSDHPNCKVTALRTQVAVDRRQQPSPGWITPGLRFSQGNPCMTSGTFRSATRNVSLLHRRGVHSNATCRTTPTRRDCPKATPKRFSLLRHFNPHFCRRPLVIRLISAPLSTTALTWTPLASAGILISGSGHHLFAGALVREISFLQEGQYPGVRVFTPIFFPGASTTLTQLLWFCRRCRGPRTVPIAMGMGASK